MTTHPTTHHAPAEGRDTMKDAKDQIAPERRVAEAGRYLTFSLHGQCYGVPIGTVREINRLATLATVPQMPAFVAGVMNLRGKVVPIVDLGLRFGFAAATRSKETCIIVIEGLKGQVGTIVDAVSGVIDLAAGQIEPPPELEGQGPTHFLLGLGKTEDKVVILIDTACVLSAATAADVQALHDIMAA
jgi:purine-binding chemotaxis protein CheW